MFSLLIWVTRVHLEESANATKLGGGAGVTRSMEEAIPIPGELGKSGILKPTREKPVQVGESKTKCCKSEREN